jgi:hypothetical protein
VRFRRSPGSNVEIDEFKFLAAYLAFLVRASRTLPSFCLLKALASPRGICRLLGQKKKPCNNKRIACDFASLRRDGSYYGDNAIWIGKCDIRSNTQAFFLSFVSSSLFLFLNWIAVDIFVLSTRRRWRLWLCRLRSSTRHRS